jgi:hypothetical protein
MFVEIPVPYPRIEGAFGNYADWDEIASSLKDADHNETAVLSR